MPDFTQPKSNEKIKVFVRVRPFMRHEIGKVEVVFTDKLNPDIIRVTDSGRYHESIYNKVFD